MTTTCGRSAVRASALAAMLVGLAPIVQAQRVVAAAAPAPGAAAGASAASFQHDVQPVIKFVCSQCHKTIGNVPVTAYMDPASIAAERDGWELILTKVRGHEMPPLDPDATPLYDDQRAALIEFVDREFERLDRAAPVDPGRVTARRLNRIEYANTVHDLLGVDISAVDELPPDDTGYGFDDIGDVLTVSPILMQRYLTVAEEVASRAVGGDPLPPPGIFTRRDRVRRLSDDVTELEAVLSYDADYAIKVNVTGHRGPEDPPVTLVISVDGTPVKTATIPVQLSAVNKQGGATQRALEDVRVTLTGSHHVFRAAFVDDAGLAKIPAKSRRDAGQNIFPELIELAGPYPPSKPVASRRPVLLCDPAGGTACVNRILTSLVHHAYRRPAEPADVARAMKTYARARAAKYTPKQSLQFAIVSVLVSPQFLFRIEHDPGPGVVRPVSDIELASRLSYFLWSSMPDDVLLGLAESGRLHDPQVLDAQVTRMLADARASALADNFASQWLETRNLDAITRDATKFPEFTPELRDAMRTETRMFFDAVLHENRPVSDFIDGRYTFLNERLADHYGIAGVTGPDFRRVDLTTDQRSGVFTQAGVLTVSAYPTRTSVVLRGKYLLENVFNAPPPPPPADVPPLDETAVGTARSLRAQMETHRTMPLCATCHTRMDPLGFALENYDAIGRWRTEDGKFPVDASGSFPDGRTFVGPAQLKAVLLESLPDFSRALAEKMMTYALGRGVESSDRPAIRELVRRLADDHYRMQTLVRGIVASAPFLERRGERVKPVVQEARNR